MKKLIVLFGLMGVCLAQGPTVHVIRNSGEINVRKTIDDLYKNFDAGNVPSGYLMNRVPISLRRPQIQQGCSDWYARYEWMERYANVDRNTARSLAEFDATVLSYTEQFVVPIGLLQYEYEEIDAAMELWEGVYQIPDDYQPRRRQLIASTCFETKARCGLNRFVLPSELIYGNETQEVYEIDFDDGRGFVRVLVNEVHEVQYSTPGKATIRVRSGEEVSDLAIEVQPATEQRSASRIIDGSPVAADEVWDVLGGEYPEGSGNQALGRAVILYGCTNAEKVMHRPFVFVSGIDFGGGNFQDDQLEISRYGDFGWEHFIQGIDVPAISRSPELLSQLHQEGYDIVFVDYQDGATYVERNALMLVELLTRINQEMEDESSDFPITIAGASMGGIVSRYALSYMEQNGLNHGVKTWISFDAPHEGANIPLGLQYTIDHLSGLSGAAEQTLDRMINRPATKELLIYHYSSFPQHHVLRQRLLSDPYYAYPQEPYNIAIANGNGQGFSQGYSAGSKLIDFEDAGELFGVPVVPVNIEISAMPNQWSTAEICEVYAWLGPFPYFIEVTVSHTLPVDNSAGGYRSSLAEFVSESGFHQSSVIHPAHAFIPTFSALGMDDSFISANIIDVLSDDDALPYSRGSALTPFDEVIVAGDFNYNHVQITPMIIDAVVRGIAPAELYLQNRVEDESIAYGAREKVTIGEDVDPVHGRQEVGKYIVESGVKVEVSSAEVILMEAGIEWREGSVVRAFIHDDWCPQVLGKRYLADKPVVTEVFQDLTPTPVEQVGNTELNIFPNPTSGPFTIKFEDSVCELRIINNNGAVVWIKETYGTNVNPDIQLQPGVYFVSAKYDTRTSYSKLVVSP